MNVTSDRLQKIRDALSIDKDDEGNFNKASVSEKNIITKIASKGSFTLADLSPCERKFDAVTAKWIPFSVDKHVVPWYDK